MATSTRNPWQVLEDAIVKKRVLNGIALLEETYGLDWADAIDLETLDLGNSTQCVLGQLYAEAEFDPSDAADAALVASWARSEVSGSDHSAQSVADTATYLNTSDGFTKGRAILDGDLLTQTGTERLGFDTSWHTLDLSELVAMGEDELAALGVTREIVDEAAAWVKENYDMAYPWVQVDFSMLSAVWRDEISERQGAPAR